MNIIKPNMKYTETLTLFKATTIHERRTQLYQRFFKGILNPKHKLLYLLGDIRNILTLIICHVIHPTCVIFVYGHNKANIYNKVLVFTPWHA